MPPSPLGILALLLVTTPLATAGPLDGPWEAVGGIPPWTGEGCPFGGTVQGVGPCPLVEPLLEWVACPWVEATVACVTRLIYDNTGVGITGEEPVAYCILLVTDGGAPEAEVGIGSGCTAAPGFLVVP